MNVQYIHLSLITMQLTWRYLYARSPMDHGTLRHFRDILHRTAVSKDYKKSVNACLDLVRTVLKGHIVARACEILGIEEPTGMSDCLC